MHLRAILAHPLRPPRSRRSARG